MPSTMLKIFSIVSCCGIIISMVNQIAYAEPHNGANIIITAKDETITARLKKSETYLANENVPIWMVRNGKLDKLDSNDVMQEVGPFTTYQDRDSSSAAVYFHKRREFDGTVDIRYIINGISIPDIYENNNNEDNEIDQMVSAPTTADHLFSRVYWGHTDQTGMKKEKLVLPEFTAEWIEDELTTESAMESELAGHRDQIFYIETLVVINHETSNQLSGKQPGSISSSVSYILTLLNSVDMLFMKIDSPNIKINIAGIVIEDERDSIPYIAKCYKKVELFTRKIETIDAPCADKIVRSYLLDQKQTISLDSYDIVLYLSRFPLHEYIFNKGSRKKQINYLAGLTASPPEGIYEYRKTDGKLKSGVIIADPGAFGSFPIIAHELVHSFGISGHDEQMNMVDGICCEKLMKPRNGYCQNCLDWSESTRIQLKNIFRSPDSCIFKNEPHSLHPPRPRRILTADEQCRCYGYESAEDSGRPLKFRKLCWNAIPDHIFGFCNNYLKCVDKNDVIHSAPVPMDGTPCNEHKESEKVCWNRACKDVKQTEEVWDILERFAKGR